MKRGKFISLLKSDSVIEMILTKVGCEFISSNNTYRFNSIDGTNRTACVLDGNTLKYTDFKHNKTSDIIELVMDRFSISELQAISLISTWLMKSGDSIVVGSCNADNKSQSIEKKLISYPHLMIEAYPPTFSKLLEKDGINYLTQIEFDIRYDVESNRILFPIYQSNSLVGLLGRLDKEHLTKNDIKYLPIIRYPKSLVLFGLDKNLDYIKKEGYVFIVESEKSVMKAFQLGVRNIVAIGGSYLSSSHVELLKDIGITNLVMLLDQDKSLVDIRGNLDEFDIKYKIVDSSTLPEKHCIVDVVNSKKNFYEFIKENIVK